MRNKLLPIAGLALAIMVMVVVMPMCVVVVVVPVVIWVVMGVVVMVMVMVMVMVVRHRLAVPGYRLAAAAYRAHQITSRSLIRISSPASGISRPPPQSGHGSSRLRISTVFPQS